MSDTPDKTDKKKAKEEAKEAKKLAKQKKKEEKKKAKDSDKSGENKLKKKLDFLFKEQHKKTRSILLIIILGLVIFFGLVSLLALVFSVGKDDVKKIDFYEIREIIPGQESMKSDWLDITKDLQEKIVIKPPIPVKSDNENETTIEKTHKVALIVHSLGLDNTLTHKIIEYLPKQVTLSFSPYSPDISIWTQTATNLGHEVIVDLPMEPADYPQTDMGPLSLMTSSSELENYKKLEKIIKSGENIKGFLALSGDKFIDSKDDIKPILQHLNHQKLFYIGNQLSSSVNANLIAETIGLPHASISVVIDEIPSHKRINKNFKITEKIAKEDGHTIALISPYPISFNRVAEWVQTLAHKNIELVPVSDLLQHGKK